MKINTYNPIKSEEAYTTSFFSADSICGPKDRYTSVQNRNQCKDGNYRKHKGKDE